MADRWLLNDLNERFAAVNAKIEALKQDESKPDPLVQVVMDLVRRVQKSEGEIMAMKARMGKNKNKARDDGNRTSSTD